MRRTRERLLKGAGGFTLLEVLLVLVIFSLSVALAAPSISNGSRGVIIKASAKKVASTIGYARNRAARDRKNYYAQAHNNRLVISAADGGSFKKELVLPDDLRLETSEGSGSVMVFYPGGGSSGGSYEVRDASDRILYMITVEPSTGGVKVDVLS